MELMVTFVLQVTITITDVNDNSPMFESGK